MDQTSVFISVHRAWCGQPGLTKRADNHHLDIHCLWLGFRVLSSLLKESLPMSNFTVYPPGWLDRLSRDDKFGGREEGQGLTANKGKVADKSKWLAGWENGWAAERGWWRCCDLLKPVISYSCNSCWTHIDAKAHTPSHTYTHTRAYET